MTLPQSTVDDISECLLVSSAYGATELFFTTSGISFTYIMNIRGPSVEHWDSNHALRLPVIPIVSVWVAKNCAVLCRNPLKNPYK